MNKEQIKKIAEENGWIDLGQQKMGTMMSFTRGEIRMNVYTSTSSVQFQSMKILRSSGANYRDVTIEHFIELVR